jgi:hypothetical protein
MIYSRMIKNHEERRMWKYSSPALTYNPSICLERLKKATHTHTHTKKLEFKLGIPEMQGSCTVIVPAQLIRELMSSLEFDVSVLI